MLLAGDAAGLVNPMTGEGIYYAVATGVLADRAAAEAVRGPSGVRWRAIPEHRPDTSGPAPAAHGYHWHD